MKGLRRFIKERLVGCVLACSRLLANSVTANDLINFIQKTDGVMTLEDLQNYKIVDRPVVSVDYRGLKVKAMGSPSGGPVALYILKLMEQYKMNDWNKDEKLTIHRLSEAMRFAYAARGHLGDPGFGQKTDVLEFEGHMLSDENIATIQKRMSDDTTRAPREYDDDKLLAVDNHGTSHIVAADRSGLVISLTTTINLNFGARIMEPNSGIIL